MTRGTTAATVDAVCEALGGRRLVWFGIRGEDAEALLQLPQFKGSFSITAPLHSASIASTSSVTFEEIAGYRPDLDRYDIDLDGGEAAAEFRRRLLRDVSGRCVVVTYRPAAFVSALAFAMADTMTLAGLFKDRQAAFEHKPWVETSLARRGVRMLRWRYVADEQRSRAKRLMANGPLVLRASRASGGVGIVRVDSDDDIDNHWPQQTDQFIAIAPFVEAGVPLNISGCVFANGVVRLHPPSVQLIGIPSCTDRPFGYCGNDFGAASALNNDVLDQLDALGGAVGRWLHEERYVGVFGVDALLKDGNVLFLEVNARFQGSSALSAQIARDLEVPDLFLDHVAASLGLTPGDNGLTMQEWATHQPPVAHVVVHNTAPVEVSRPAAALSLPPGFRLTLVPPVGLHVDSGGVLGRFTTMSSITETGYAIDDEADRVAALVAASFADSTQRIAEHA